MPTETLRAMLDERGVTHFDRYDVTEWVADDGEICHTSEINSNGASVMVLRKCTTPAQAIAATLGRGECHNLKASWPSLFECDECGYSNDDTYCGSELHFKFCPNCGAMVMGA